jgi:hypothetical protein
MNTQEEAYIKGFVKRANQYGLTSNEALALLKAANSPLPVGQSPADVAVREAVMAPINWAGDKLSQGASAIGDYFKNFNATHPRVGNAGAEAQFARTLGKKGNEIAPVAMPTRASVLNASAVPTPVAAQPQPAAAIADPSLYQRLGVNFNGSPNYKSPANNPNEADQNDALRFKR